MCIPARKNSAASIIRIWRSTPRRPRSPPRSKGVQAPNDIGWAAETKTAHADYLAFSEKPTECRAAVNVGEIMVWLRGQLKPDDIICNGAGNFSAWIHRFYRFRKFGTLLGPTSGSMGYGVPAAVAMKRLYPERTVFCLAGDGDFLMNGQEFATAVQYDLPVIIAIVDNGMYGTIRMHQEREYPGRVVATALKNPDFAAYARAFGGFGATGREDGGLRQGVRGRAGLRQAGDHPYEGRSGGDHAVDDPAAIRDKALTGRRSAERGIGTARPKSVIRIQ